MNYTVTFIVLFFLSTAVLADDAETNPLAQKIKSKIQRKVNHKFNDYHGYCDVMIEMEHRGKKAFIKKATGSGDTKVCRYVKSNLKKGQSYKYNFPEKYIRLHISSD